MAINITYAKAAERIAVQRQTFIDDMENLFKQIDELTRPEDKTGIQRMIEKIQEGLNKNYAAEDLLSEFNTAAKELKENEDKDTTRLEDIQTIDEIMSSRTYGAPPPSNIIEGERRYGGYIARNGGDRKELRKMNQSQLNNVLNDPTFKVWFAKNARRKDVMEASSNPEVLKSLFLADISMKELPLFSGEIDDFGTVDKSGRSLGTSFKMIGQQFYGGNIPKAQESLEIDYTIDPATGGEFTDCPPGHTPILDSNGTPTGGCRKLSLQELNTQYELQDPNRVTAPKSEETATGDYDQPPCPEGYVRIAAGGKTRCVIHANRQEELQKLNKEVREAQIKRSEEQQQQQEQEQQGPRPGGPKETAIKTQNEIEREEYNKNLEEQLAAGDCVCERTSDGGPYNPGVNRCVKWSPGCSPGTEEAEEI